MARNYNLARMTTATTGTGTITLGSAVSGFLTFDGSGVQNGETITYAIKDGVNSEIGRGVYTASGTTLTRSVLRSTNSDTPISLSGTAQVFITAAAEDFEPRINAQTGTSYTIASSDCGKTVTLSNASAIAVTLPAATGAFGDGWHGYVANVGSSTATITPSSGLIAGAASFTLNRSQAVQIVSDGTNWIVLPMTGLRGASTTVASASTCDIGTTATDRVSISGTTTITSFGTVPNVIRFVSFAAALTLTHNATALVLPGGANIITGAGDALIASSDSSGNWRVLSYTAATQDRARANIIAAPVDASAQLGLCVNPFFEISQENGTTLMSDVGSGAYAADQWKTSESAATLVLSTQNVETPFSGTAGFKRLASSAKAIATTAQASLGSSEVCAPIQQTIEGTYWRSLGWGTSDARDAVVVGVVMASVTGTYAVTLRNAAGNRSMVKTVSLTANTPTVILETFSADTSGTWVTTNAASAILGFGVTSGSTYETATLGSWQSADYRSATTATDWQGTLNAFVQVGYLNVFPAGVLPWTSASEITGEALQRLLNMRRPFDDERRRCQRYFDAAYFPSYYENGAASSVLYLPKTFAVEKAITPSVALPNSTNLAWNHLGDQATPTTFTAGAVTTKGFHLVISLGTGLTGHFAFSANINGRL